MKILITGIAGSLGTALTEKLSPDYDIIGLDRRKQFNTSVVIKNYIDCDITDRDKLKQAILDYNPEIIIHVAAITDVDLCQREPQLAHQVNALGTENVVLASQTKKALLIYLSTDYVFDGNSQIPYQEADTPNPINIYGKTKLEGEEKVKNILKKYLIIRPAWLFGPGGANFVEYIKGKIKKEKLLNIVNDKFATPTYTEDLAQAIRQLIKVYSEATGQLRNNIHGIYHITNSGSCSWLDWAREILDDLGVKGIKINPISLEELKLSAPRPKMTILDNSRYINLMNQPLRGWTEALKDYLKQDNN